MFLTFKCHVYIKKCSIRILIALVNANCEGKAGRTGPSLALFVLFILSALIFYMYYLLLLLFWRTLYRMHNRLHIQRRLRVFSHLFIKCVYNPATFSTQWPPKPAAYRTMSETHFIVFIPSTGAAIQASSTCLLNSERSVSALWSQWSSNSTAHWANRWNHCVHLQTSQPVEWNITRPRPALIFQLESHWRSLLVTFKAGLWKRKKKMTRRRRHSFSERVIPFVAFQVWLHK